MTGQLLVDVPAAPTAQLIMLRYLSYLPVILRDCQDLRYGLRLIF